MLPNTLLKDLGCEVNIMSVENNDLLKKNFNKKILRNKQETLYKDDLQSFFTLLRFFLNLIILKIKF